MDEEGGVNELHWHIGDRGAIYFGGKVAVHDLEFSEDEMSQRDLPVETPDDLLLDLGMIFQARARQKGDVTFTETPTAVGKIGERLGRIEAAARAVEGQEVANVLADCERALKRAAKRAEALAGEWERVEVVQSRGATVEFTGRMLGEHGHESRKGFRHEAEVWETKGGALVAVSSVFPLNGNGFDDIRASVIQPQEDAQAMRFAVLDHFNWDQGVRNMVTKKLGWSLRMEVE